MQTRICDFHYCWTDSGVAVLFVESLNGLSQLLTVKWHPQESEGDGYDYAHDYRSDDLMAREVHERDHDNEAASANIKCLDYHDPPVLREHAVLVERHEVVDGDGVAEFHDYLRSVAER